MGHVTWYALDPLVCLFLREKRGQCNVNVGAHKSHEMLCCSSYVRVEQPPCCVRPCRCRCRSPLFLVRALHLLCCVVPSSLPERRMNMCLVWPTYGWDHVWLYSSFEGTACIRVRQGRPAGTDRHMYVLRTYTGTRCLMCRPLEPYVTYVASAPRPSNM